MTEFLGSTLKAHTDAFDHLVEQTDAALSHPMVVEQLGDLAVTLRQANSELIFPNIIDGRIEVPASKIETNGALLLPIFNHDKDAVNETGLGSTILRPTPQKEAWLAQKILETDPTLDILALIDKEHERFTKGLEKARLSRFKLPLGMTLNAASEIIPGSPPLYSTRSIILASSTVIRGDTAFLGHVTSHELAHALGNETAEAKPTPDQNAENELLSYHIGHSILKAYYPHASRAINRPFRRTLHVERLRLELTDPSTPFTTTPTLTKKLKRLGFLD